VPAARVPLWLQALLGVVWATLTWYALTRVSISFELAAGSFQDSSFWWNLALSAVGLVSSVVLLWPVATLAGGLAMAASIFVARIDALFKVCDFEDPDLWCMLYGTRLDVIMVMAGLWLGAGLLLTIRQVRAARRSAGPTDGGTGTRTASRPPTS
jgi:hypothetical protein